MNAGKSGVASAGILCADILGKTINELPEKGKLSLIDKISLQIGGCAANVAIGLAKIGVPSTIIGKIGEDSLGDFVSSTLKKEMVNIAGLKTAADVSTSASMVMIDTGGERSIIHSLGANQHFCFDDINLQIVSQSKILLIAGTFLMPSFDGEGTRRLLQFASEQGVLCCMDTAWDATGQWMNKIESSLPYLDWFMPSYDEACELTGQSDPAAIAAVLFSKGVKNVIIKMNAEGCYVEPSNQEGFMVPSFNRVKAIDSSGAGDSFCAGFITGLYHGWSILQSATFANAVGAHCIMEIGTTSGIKPMDEVLEFITEYNS
jgi:sugar/nucleoside kinase (ribokinase family)